MSIKDLVTGPDGRLSHLKVWSNIAYLAATIVFLRLGWTDKITYEFFLVYMGTVGGSHLVSKWLDTRNGNSSDSKDDDGSDALVKEKGK